MRAKIVSTDKIVALDAAGKIKARVWEGVSENGVPFVLYVAYTQVRRVEDTAEFDRDLRECKEPDAETMRAINARMIL
jgi:hypothetical protein